jgi:hypothetical protein
VPGIVSGRLGGKKTGQGNEVNKIRFVATKNTNNLGKCKKLETSNTIQNL